MPGIELRIASPRFFSPGDERSLFQWLEAIPAIRSIKGVFRDLHLEVELPIGDDDLRELIAVLHRYKIPMSGLSAFLTEENQVWFKKPGTYWHEGIFGTES